MVHGADNSCTDLMLVESFRFKDENKYVVLKKRHPRKFQFTFFHQQKLVRLFILKEVKPSPDSERIKLLTFDNLFLPLRHSR